MSTKSKPQIHFGPNAQGITGYTQDGKRISEQEARTALDKHTADFTIPAMDELLAVIAAENLERLNH